MPDLNFVVQRAQVPKFSAVPMITFVLRVDNPDSVETIHSIALRCQIQLDVTRRRYTTSDQTHLRDLFGEPERWSQTLRNMLWTHASVNVPPFRALIEVELPVPCTFDFNVAATKYFHGLENGDVPLSFLFSGTVFYGHEGDQMLVSPISWEKEARFNLPVKVWREMMDVYYPNTAWLCLRRDVFERIYDYKVRHGIPTWEQALESMLEVEEAVRR